MAVLRLVGTAVAAVVLFRIWRARRASRSFIDVQAQTEWEQRRADFKEPSGAAVRILTNPHGLRLYTRVWAPPGPARGVVVGVHGHTWTSLYWGALAQALNKQGLAMWAHDAQGHGLSDAAFGLRGYAPSLGDLVTDVELVIQHAVAQHPGVPVFIYAESLGGTVTLQLSRRLAAGSLDGTAAGKALRGFVLAAPVVRLSPALLPPPPVLAALKLVARLAPRLEIPDDTIKNTYLDAFGDRELGQKLVDEGMVTLQRGRVGFVVSLLSTLDDLVAHLEQITAPLLVIHGLNDTRVELRHSEELVQRVSSADKALFAVPSMAHQPFQDQPQVTQRVLDEMLAWITHRI